MLLIRLSFKRTRNLFGKWMYVTFIILLACHNSKNKKFSFRKFFFYFHAKLSFSNNYMNTGTGYIQNLIAYVFCPGFCSWKRLFHFIYIPATTHTLKDEGLLYNVNQKEIIISVVMMVLMMLGNGYSTKYSRLVGFLYTD